MSGMAIIDRLDIPGATVVRQDGSLLTLRLDSPRMGHDCSTRYDEDGTNHHDHETPLDDPVDYSGDLTVRAWDVPVAKEFFERISSIAVTNADAHEAIHFPGMFDPLWLSRLPLPPSERSTSLTNYEGFWRGDDADAYKDVGARLTRVHESIDTRHSGWYSLVALHLEHLMDCQVRSDMYQSSDGDDSLHPHFDNWLGLITQMSGEKVWTLWEAPGQPPRQLITRAGDVLLMPKTVKHAVSTPDSSTHLVFTIMQHKPLLRSA